MTKKRKATRRYLIFFCLLLSVLYWFSLKLSKNYTQEYRFAVEFVNTPKGKLLTYQSDTNIRVSVDAKGAYMLKFEFGKRKIKVDYASVTTAEQRKRNHITIKKDKLKTYLVEQMKFPKSSKIVEPSAITIELENTPQ